jgi:hypothetical protein
MMNGTRTFTAVYQDAEITIIAAKKDGINLSMEQLLADLPEIKKCHSVAKTDFIFAAFGGNITIDSRIYEIASAACVEVKHEQVSS